MKTGTHVTVRKVFIENARPSLTFPIQYWSRGILAEDVRVGRPICMNRYERSNQYEGEPDVVKRDGIFESSAIKEIIPVAKTANAKGEFTELYIKTENSLWHMEILPPITI